MASKVFKSKIDWWVGALLIVAILAEFFVIGAIVMEGEEPLGTTVIILICILAILLFASVLLGTVYTVDRRILKINSGPFRWKVPLDQIDSVEATRSPWSSPALSLDRLRIRYGKTKQVLVSPADREAFLNAIGQELTNE